MTPLLRMRYHRSRNEVAWCLKYTLFVFNVIVWFIGVIILTVGIWSWMQKGKFSDLSHFNNIAYDPAFFLIVAGIVVFFVGFAGCVGALREMPTLLLLYIMVLIVVLIAEISFVFMLTSFKEWVKLEASEGLEILIRHYREDADQQNFLDWIQYDWLECCGIEGPKDWDKNEYFSCSSQETSNTEACGVPFSCCRKQPNDLSRSKQCGHDVRKGGYYYDDSAKMIYEKGCIQSLEEWVERYLLHITTAVVLITFSKVMIILLTQHFRSDIEARKQAWQ